MRKEPRMSLIQRKRGKLAANRVEAAVRADRVVIREALLLQPEAAHPSSMPRLVAKATRIRARALDLNRSLGNLIQPAVAPLNSMLKRVAKVTKINNIFV